MKNGARHEGYVSGTGQTGGKRQDKN